MAALDNGKPKFWTPEALATGVLAAASFFSGELSVIPFWLRLLFAVATLLFAADWCLRSEFAAKTLPSFQFRFWLSVIAMMGGAYILTPSLRTQYAQEHAPPSFALVMPYLWFGDKWEWIIRHYGPLPIQQVNMMIIDLDEARAFPVKGAETDLGLQFPALDPADSSSLLPNTYFGKAPVNASSQHYQIDSQSWDGKPGETNFIEELSMTRKAPLTWSLHMRVINQSSRQVVLSCDEDNFISLTTRNSPLSSCTSYTYGPHHGDVTLPLQLPKEHPLGSLILRLYALSAFLLFYWSFADWWTRRYVPTIQAQQ